MGLGPLALAQEDMIFILPRCNVPFLIRREGDHHVVIGKCFVWGLMDSEAIGNRNGIDEYEVFLLR
jgi:hypothetical protein